MPIGSRIQERDKKNAEYYVGDYFLKVYFSISDFHLSNTGLEITVMFVGVFPKWALGFLIDYVKGHIRVSFKVDPKNV